MKATERIDCILEDGEGTRVEYKNVQKYEASPLCEPEQFWIITTENGQTASFNMRDWDLFIVRTRVSKVNNIYR